MFDRIDEGRWWDFGWQLVEGCTKCSPGCENCWSLAKEARFRKETGVVFHPERLERPLKRKKPTSYSIWNDLFHPDVPFEFIDRASMTMGLCPQHIFIILTKRPERLLEYRNRFINNDDCNNITLSNVWLGVTAENQEMWDKRVGILKQIPAAVRFVSAEPLLGPIDATKDLLPGFKDIEGLYTDNPPPEPNLINWVIIGAESGPKRRWLDTTIVKPLVTQCKEAGVPCFVKQLHSVHANNPTLVKAPAGWPREMPEGVAK